MNKFEKHMLMVIARGEGKNFSKNLSDEIEALTRFKLELFEELEKVSRVEGINILRKYAKTCYLISIMETDYLKLELDYIEQLGNNLHYLEETQVMSYRKEILNEQIKNKEESNEAMRRGLKSDEIADAEEQAYNIIFYAEKLSTDTLLRDTYSLLNCDGFGINENLSDVESNALDDFARGFVKARK